MEIAYKVEPEDFVAFNLSYMYSSRVMKVNVRNTSIVSAGLVLVGGCILMEVLGCLTPVSAGLYALLSAAVYFMVPHLMKRRVRRGILAMLARPQNKSICSEKKLSLTEKEIILAGGGEDSHYEYRVVEGVTEDAAHFFIYVGPMAALIVPFRAFQSGEEKAAFYRLLCERVKQSGGQIAA